MLRILIILALLLGVLQGTAGPANAEIMRPDLGMNLTNNTTAFALSPQSKMMVIIPDPLLDAGRQGRMAISPVLFDAEMRALRAQALLNFWSYMSILALFFLGGAYVLGRQVSKRGWKVGYTRKTQALGLYFLPYVAMHGPSPYSPIMTATISLGVFTLLLMSLSAPIRNRVPAMATAFASIDRPEDRPFTLTWLITSVLAAWLVLLLWLWVAPQTAIYIFVALFISGVGDALAEPVGLRFGRHSYRTKALGTDRTYIRTYEGSAAVFLSGVLAVFLVHGFTFDARGVAALVLFPIAGALAEAKSPHTWDQPFIIGICGLVALGLSAVLA